jgi:hypothetical protein
MRYASAIKEAMRPESIGLIAILDLAVRRSDEVSK